MESFEPMIRMFEGRENVIDNSIYRWPVVILFPRVESRETMLNN